MKIRGIDFRVWLLCLVAIFPVLPMAYVSWLIGVWGGLSLVWGLARERSALMLRLRSRGATWIFVSGLLGFYALSLLYSDNIDAGLGKISQGASIALFPFLLLIVNPPFNRKGWEMLAAIFLLACLGQALMMNYYFFVSLGLPFSLTPGAFNNLPFRTAVYEAVYGEYHPTYVALWYAFGIYLALDFGRRKEWRLRVLMGIVVAVLLASSILLSSRIGLIGATTVVFLFIMHRTKGKWMWAFLAVLFLFSSVIIGFVPSIRTRFVKEFQVTEWAPPVGARHNSVNLRIGTYMCVKDIFVEHPSIGVGIGDVQDALDQCYSKYDTDAYSLRNYNTHNFFFHILLACGVLGLLYFLFLLFRCFGLAFYTKDRVYQTFLILCLSFMLFENLLSRFHGVVFFAIFNSVFISLHLHHVNRFLGIVSQPGRKTPGSP